MKSKNTAAKKAIAKSRAIAPEIYVRIKGLDPWSSAMAKASIRVKAGEYQYLTWRDGSSVRTFYLGRKRKSCPTGSAISAPGRRRRRAARRPAGVGQKG
jgi:hypothetical protein